MLKAEIKHGLGDFELDLVVQLGIGFQALEPGPDKGLAGDGVEILWQKGIEACPHVDVGAPEDQGHQFGHGYWPVAHAFPGLGPDAGGNQAAIKGCGKRARQNADHFRRIPVRHDAED